MSPYEEKNFSYRLATFLVYRPKTAILLGLLLSALFLPGLRFLEADFSYRIWFRPSDPLLQKFDAFERRFGNDEALVVAVHSPSGIFDVATAEMLRDLTADMWQVAEIIRVESLANYNWVHSVVNEEDPSEREILIDPLIPDEGPLDAGVLAERRLVALNHEVIPNYLVNEQADTALIFAYLKPAIGGSPDFQRVMESARAVIDKYREAYGTGTGAADADHTFYIAGGAAISQTFREVTQSDLQNMVPLLMGAVVLFLLFCFRRVSGLLLPFVVIFFTLSATLGFAGWTGLKFNNLTATVPHILIAISIADAVHILVTYFQFRRLGFDRKDGLHKTMVKNIMPTLLTSLSTAIGFFSFATAELVPIVNMGILAGVGTLMAWLVTMLLVAPLLSMLPLKVKLAEIKHTEREAHPLALRYAQWLQNHRRTVMAGFAITAVVAIYVGLQNEVNSDPFKYFAPEVRTRVANEFIESKVGGTAGFEFVIDSGEVDGIKSPAFLRKLETYQTWLEEADHVTKTVALPDIIKQVNRSLHNDDQAAYVLPDDQATIAQELFFYTMGLPQGMDLTNRMTLEYDQTRLTALTHLHESKRSLQEIARMEAKAQDMGLNAYVTGKIPLYHGMNGHVVRSFFRSISMALILVSLLMVWVLRSWKLGLIAMIPNSIPLVFGAALMTMLGKALDIGTVLVGSTCLGIAVDDTVHFLANYHRWIKAGSSKAEAVAHVITHTGPALLVTTLILVAAFGTFAFASFVPNINFGILTAIVLSTALFADVTLLPAILMGGQTQEATAPAVQQAAPVPTS